MQREDWIDGGGNDWRWVFKDLHSSLFNLPMEREKGDLERCSYLAMGPQVARQGPYSQIRIKKGEG